MSCHPRHRISPAASPMTGSSGDPVCRGFSIPSQASLEYWGRPVIGERKRRRPSDGYAGRRRLKMLRVCTLQTHVCSPAARCARAVARSFPPFKSEGVGNAGCPMHPQPRVRILVVSKHTSIHSERPESRGIPARNGFNRLPRALPGEVGSFASVASRIKGFVRPG
jgi:hypothetical protein